MRKYKEIKRALEENKQVLCIIDDYLYDEGGELVLLYGTYPSGDIKGYVAIGEHQCNGAKKEYIQPYIFTKKTINKQCRQYKIL